MKKSSIVIIVSLIIFFAVFVGFKVYNNIESGDNEQIKSEAYLSEAIEDECTEEWERLNENNVEVSTSEQITLSPNCSFTFNTYFENCGHITTEYMDIPQEFVNKTEKDIKEKYSDWTIDTFENNKVVLSKQQEGDCGQHYVLRELDNKIVVYLINENGEEEEYQRTEISTEYLTETDRITIQNGLKVFGKQSLNQIIEDFE